MEPLDACFGFVRKKSAGCSLNPPKYEMCMFGDQPDVDNFIHQYSKELKKAENVLLCFININKIPLQVNHFVLLIDLLSFIVVICYKLTKNDLII